MRTIDFIDHSFLLGRRGKTRRYSVIAALFAVSGLICWCGISQVISNSVTSALDNAFHIPPLYTTIVLVAAAAVIVLRKNATVKVLDLIVPVMAGSYNSSAVQFFDVYRNSVLCKIECRISVR